MPSSKRSTRTQAGIEPMCLLWLLNCRWVHYHWATGGSPALLSYTTAKDRSLGKFSTHTAHLMGNRVHHPLGILNYCVIICFCSRQLSHLFILLLTPKAFCPSQQISSFICILYLGTPGVQLPWSALEGDVRESSVGVLFSLIISQPSLP